MNFIFYLFFLQGNQLNGPIFSKPPGNSSSSIFSTLNTTNNDGKIEKNSSFKATATPTIESTVDKRRSVDNSADISSKDSSFDDRIVERVLLVLCLVSCGCMIARSQLLKLCRRIYEKLLLVHFRIPCRNKNYESQENMHPNNVILNEENI